MRAGGAQSRGANRHRARGENDFVSPNDGPPTWPPAEFQRLDDQAGSETRRRLASDASCVLCAPLVLLSLCSSCSQKDPFVFFVAIVFVAFATVERQGSRPIRDPCL